MKVIAIVLVGIIALAAAGLLFVYSGIYNIAATAPHWR